MSLDKVKKALRIGKLVHNNHIPTSIALTNKSAQEFVEIDNKIFVIYPKIAGKVLHGKQLNEMALREVSKYLARFHNLPKANIRAKSRKNSAVRKMLTEISANNDVSDILNESLELKLKVSKQIELNNNFDALLKDQCLIHADFHNENILFNDSFQITALLDFDDAHLGNRVEDIVSFIMLGLCNENFSDENIARAKLFLLSYNEYAPKSIDNKTLEQGLLYYLYRLTNSIFFEQKLYQDPSDISLSMLRRDIAKIKYLQNNILYLSNNIIR